MLSRAYNAPRALKTGTERVGYHPLMTQPLSLRGLDTPSAAYMQAECVERLSKLAQHAFLRRSSGPTKEVVRVGSASDGSKRISYTYDALSKKSHMRHHVRDRPKSSSAHLCVTIAARLPWLELVREPRSTTSKRMLLRDALHCITQYRYK